MLRERLREMDLVESQQSECEERKRVEEALNGWSIEKGFPVSVEDFVEDLSESQRDTFEAAASILKPAVGLLRDAQEELGSLPGYGMSCECGRALAIAGAVSQYVEEVASEIRVMRRESDEQRCNAQRTELEAILDRRRGRASGHIFGPSRKGGCEREL